MVGRLFLTGDHAEVEVANKRKEKKSKAIAALGLFATLLTTIIGKVPKAPPAIAIILGFILSAGLLIFALVQTDWVQLKKGFFKVVRIGVVIASVIIGMSGIGWWAWPEDNGPTVHVVQFSPRRECR